jgi:hypothetical protein
MLFLEFIIKNYSCTGIFIVTLKTTNSNFRHVLQKGKCCSFIYVEIGTSCT